MSSMESSGEWKVAYDKAITTLDAGSALLGVYGRRGSGKTQLAAALCKLTIDADKTARYIRAADLFMAIRDAQAGRSSEMGIVKEFGECDLLIIDEMHDRAESAFETRLLNRIIDERYGEMADTLLIANYTRQEFVEALGPSIVSRMNECGGLIACDGPSFRGGKA